MCDRNITDSPFAHILGTNHVPSPVQAIEISDCISGPAGELSQLNDEIARLSSLLADVLVKRDKVKEYVDAHRALLAPARRLPDDIIGEIFIQCLPTDRNPTRSLAEAPLLLGLICRSWRNISSSTPRLWNAIHVFVPIQVSPSPLPQTISELVEVRRQGVQRWLKRSGVLPLSISVSMTALDVVDEPSMTVENFAQTIIQFSSRWKNIDLEVPATFIKVVEQLRPSDVPYLEKLQLNLPYVWPLAGPDEPPVDILADILRAPTIRAVSIVHSPQHPHTLALRWGNITHLSVQNYQYTLCFDTGQVLKVLAQCRRLRKCTLTVNVPQTVPENHPTQIDLPNLVDLRLWMLYEDPYDPSSSADDSVRALFAPLSAPSLKCLVLSTGGNNIWTRLPFLPLLSDPLCQLERLDVTFPATSGALLECLRLTPHLAELRINQSIGQGLEDAHLRLFIPTEASPLPLSPHLEEVTLTIGYPDVPALDETILQIAQSRWRPTNPKIAKLKKFVVSIPRPMHADIRCQISALQEEGMDFNPTYLALYDPVDRSSPSAYSQIWD